MMTAIGEEKSSGITSFVLLLDYAEKIIST